MFSGSLPTPFKCCFGVVKGRRAPVLVQDRATRCRVVAFARPSPRGQAVTQKENPYSTGPGVDSLKFVLKKLEVALFVQLPVLLKLKSFLWENKINKSAESSLFFLFCGFLFFSAVISFYTTNFPTGYKPSAHEIPMLPLVPTGYQSTAPRPGGRILTRGRAEGP